MTQLTKKQIYFAEVAARDAIRAEKRAKLNALIEQRAEKERARKEDLRQRRLFMMKVYEELGSYAAGARIVGLSIDRFRNLVLRAQIESGAIASHSQPLPEHTPTASVDENPKSHDTKQNRS